MTIEYIINGVVMCLILVIVSLALVWWMFRGPE